MFREENNTFQEMSYLVVTRVSALRRLIVAVPAMSGEEIFTFSFQGVDATLEVDIEARTIVDRERSLRRHVVVRWIQRVLQALLVYAQKAREVDARLRHLDVL